MEKAMKLLATVLLVLLTAGCMTRVDSADVRAALYVCQKHDGFDYMGSQYIYCNDGTEMWIQNAYEELQERNASQ
jgi:hypothetical protein